MLNVTYEMSKIDFERIENGIIGDFRVIPQMVSTLRYNLIFGIDSFSKKVFDEKQGDNFSFTPSMDEMKGKSYIRLAEH